MGKKAPKSAPRTTALAVSVEAVATTLTAFSPAASHYAHLSAAPDAHTLRVFETATGKCISRWASNAAGQNEGDEPRVKSIEWCWVPSAHAGEADQQAEGKRGKKRRKSDGGGAVDSPAKPSVASLKPQPPQLTLALGFESGSILLWPPSGTASRTLSHPTSTSPITALATPVSSSAQEDGHIWSAHQDGSVRVWDLVSGNVVGKVSGLTEEPRWDDLVVRYEPAAEGSKRTVHLVLSHLSLRVCSLQLGAASRKQGKVRDLNATELGRCTGHVEPCSVRWTGLSSTPASPADFGSDAPVDKLTFLSYSPTDRFVQVWQIATTSPSPNPHIGLLLARLALDSGVASAIVSSLLPSTATQTLAAIDSATGNVSLASLPLSFASHAESSTPSKKGKKHGLGVVALDVACEITARAPGGKNEANVAEVAFREGEEGKALLCRGGIKPVFESVAVKEEGAWLKKVELARSASGLLVGNGVAESAGAPQPTRYSEQASASVAAATSAPDAAAASDDEEVVGNSGELDVDMAEPTLADRLKALNFSQKKERKAAARKQRAMQGDDVEVASESDDEEFDEEDFEDDEEEGATPSVPATTLTTTLVQALHSQDGPLLESCLAHSNPNLVRSTVKRLPSGGLVLSLLEAIVERLGKQKKGREGMSSVKRARALVAWLKETLVVHVGFLVTIPSLVSRLAALHASLTQRIALQPTLLSLHGRLELVMSQIDLRQDRARAASQRQLAAALAKPRQGRRYVEGESTDEEGGEEGDSDIEDVVLGAAGEGASDEDGDAADEDEEGEGELDNFDEDDDDVDSDLLDEEDGADSRKLRHKRNGVESLLDLEAEDDEDFDDDADSLEGEEGYEDLSDDSEAGEDEEFEA